MAELKTQRNDGDVNAFIDSVENDIRRRDAETMLEMMGRLSGEKAEMWGTSIVGFGAYTYRPKAGGSLNEWPMIGFSPRKAALTLYILDGTPSSDELLDQLGPHSTGKSCLYIRNLEKVDLDVLEQLITKSIEETKEQVSDDD